MSCTPLLCLRSAFVFVIAPEEPTKQLADEVCRRDLVEAAAGLWLDEHRSSLTRQGVAGIRDLSSVGNVHPLSVGMHAVLWKKRFDSGHILILRTFGGP
jgi:hypothetical protein